MVHDLGRKAEAVVRLVETRIVSAAQEEIRRLRMAVGRKQVAQGVEGKTEWVHLPVREVFNVRTILAEAIDVAPFDRDLLSVGAGDRAGVDIAVAGIDPAVDPARKAVVQAMRVALSELAKEDFSFL